MLDLGRLRKEQDRYGEALECFDRAIALEPSQPQAHFLRASTLARASFTHEAIASTGDCLELRPDHIGALLGLGHVLKAVGDYDGAVASYDACIRQAPDSGETYWSLANLKTYRFDDATVAEMETARPRPARTRSREVNFLFALGKAYEDRGDYERAWDHYRRGNEKQRAEVHYDPVQTEVDERPAARGLHGRFPRVARRRRPPRSVADLHPRPAALGLDAARADPREPQPRSRARASCPTSAASRPRSTAIATTASTIRRRCASWRLRTSRALGEEYLALARMHRARGAPRFIDKMPNNFPNVGLIALILPNAKIIDARRHPLDACLSCYRQLFAKGQNFTYDLTEIGEYYLQYQRMMDHWARVLPGRVLTVQYEEVVADFETQVRRLLEFCGLPWEDACLRFYESERPVRTPSSEQVRQPIYDRSVGHWRNYEGHLGELIEVIAPIRERYRRYEPAGRASGPAGDAAPPGIAPGGT